MNHSPIPRYYRISNMLKNRIVNGVYKRGESIPTENQLCEDFGVSRVTVRQALNILEQQGLIVKRQGVGTFISENLTIQPIVFTGYIEDIMYQQIGMKVVDVKIEQIVPGHSVSKILHVPIDSKITKVKRVRHLGNQVISYAENFFPQHVAQFIKEEDVLQHSFVELLDQYGFIQEKATQNILAISAPAEIACKLEIPPLSPVLFSEIVIYSVDGEPINLVHVYNRADRYQYTVKMGSLSMKKAQKKEKSN